jgi:hypothetical protein
VHVSAVLSAGRAFSINLAVVPFGGVRPANTPVLSELVLSEQCNIRWIGQATKANVLQRDRPQLSKFGVPGDYIGVLLSDFL